MKLLFVTPYLPGPPLFGGARRIRGLLTELARTHEVSLLALVDGTVDQQLQIADAKTYCRRVETVPDRWVEVSGRPKRALQLGSVLSPWSWEHWLYNKAAFQQALDDHLQLYAYDIIVCEFAFMANYEFTHRPGTKRPILVLDEHNIEYDLLRRTAEATENPGRRAFHELNWRKLKREEIAIWRRFDACALTSVRDQQLLQAEVPELKTAVVPNGVDIDGFTPQPESQVVPNTLLFFGAINYYPNTDGALFFAQQILPLLRSDNPSLRLLIVGPVGEGPVTDLRKENIEVLGFVDDVKEQIAKAEVVVVPLRIGGGTRLKILEAMAMGKTIVSTRLGAEGLDVEHDRDILLADTPEEFAAEVRRALGDGELRKRLGAAARETVVRDYSWRSAAARLESLFQELLQDSEAPTYAEPARAHHPAAAGNGKRNTEADLSVTALVCTRNRPHQITNAVRSLLRGDDPGELIVVDQSSDRETEQALAEWKSDPRFVYHRATTIGKGAGLNEGLRMARGAVIVLTDDDCEVPPGWANEMARVLQSQPQVAVLFCNVLPVPHDRSQGYVPSYERANTRLLRNINSVRNGLGLGAGMAVRRDVVQKLGGFDETFGPGGRFPSADEWDMCMRALLSGWQVCETPELSILHDGFRSFAEGRTHARRDWIALGAVCAKPLRAGHLEAIPVPLFVFSSALWPPISDLLHLRRPRGAGRIAAFARGFVDGLKTPVDRVTMRFNTPR